MALYGTEFSLIYNAWNTNVNSGVAGDVANHTLYWVKDGVATATTNSPSEVDATNLPGIYKVTITAAEASCTFGTLGGKSSTPYISIMPVLIPFEDIPTSGEIASNVWSSTSRTLTANTNLDIPTISGISQDVWNYTSRTLTANTNLGISSSGDIAGAVWNNVSRTLTADDNINYPGSGDIAGAVWQVVSRTLTAGDNIGFPTSGEIASAVWQNPSRTLTSNTNLNIISSGDMSAAVWSYVSRTLTSAANFGTLDVNVASVNNVSQTNVIVAGTVESSAFEPTLVEFETATITEATPDHYNGRIIVFTTGLLAQQACTINDYALVGAKGHFTVSSLTEAPASGDTFAIY